MARFYQWIGLAALSFALTGCVTQEKYAALKLERDQIAEQLGRAQNDANTARSEAELIKGQMTQIGRGNESTAALINNLNSQIGDLNKANADLAAKYQDAMSKMGNLGTQLTPQLTNELTAFAQANPDLVEFDAARGTVKFKSDVTFSAGSAEVTAKARDVIGRFSTILTSASASGYELMIAGHTDNTKVSNPGTIAAGHKDNWYLSGHRAIAVAAELFRTGVSANRLAISGYADQRPIASNSTDGGRAQNRRVEVLILPTTVRQASGGTSGFSATPTKAAAAHPVLNKDTVMIDKSPMNK